MRRYLATAAVMALLVACGGSGPKTYNADRSLRSLEAAGWTATKGPVTSTTPAGIPPVAYLMATAPDGQRVDLRFLASPDTARQELEAVRAKTPNLQGGVLGNVVVTPATADAAVPGPRVQELRKLLKT